MDIAAEPLSAIARDFVVELERVDLAELPSIARLWPVPQPISRICASRGGRTSRRISACEDLAAARDTTSGARRARPFARRRCVPSAEHQLAVEHEGGERGDEDRRDERPPGWAMQRSGQDPGEGLVEQEAGALDGEKLDLHPSVLALAVAAETPPAVEHEADADRHQNATTTASIGGITNVARYQ